MAIYKYQVGDIVELNSGGPPMTIDRIDTDYVEDIGQELNCTWFVEADETASAKFYSCMVKPFNQKCPDCGSPERDMGVPKV